MEARVLNNDWSLNSSNSSSFYYWIDMNELKEIMNSIVSFSEEFYGNLTEEDIEEIKRLYIEFRMRFEEALIESRSIITRFDWKNHYDKTMQIFKAFMNDMQQIVGKHVGKLNKFMINIREKWTNKLFYKNKETSPNENSWQEYFSSYLTNIPYLQNYWANDERENSPSESFMESLKSAVPSLLSNLPDYEDIVKSYMDSIYRKDPVCKKQVLTCPDGVEKFTANTCCSSQWLSVGAPIGLGNECWFDLQTMMDQCSVYSCYGVDNGHFNISDGCTWLPDQLLNYEACVIHDLCYITPGLTKSTCDEVMQENINLIYCNNVNRYERILCSMRAMAASNVLGWTDQYFVDAGIFRDKCHRSDSYLSILWKSTLGKYMNMG